MGPSRLLRSGQIEVLRGNGAFEWSSAVRLLPSRVDQQSARHIATN